MIYFLLSRYKCKLFNIKFFIFIFCSLIFSFILDVHAEGRKPLWSPEDVVTRPEIGITDVSSDGKYSLLETIYTSPKENDFKELVQCVLVNNEDLSKKIIGTDKHKCKHPLFIGQSNNFSYFFKYQNKEKEEEYVLVINSIASGKTIEVQKFGKDFDNYAFAPDGKSFIYSEIKEQKDQGSRIEAGKEDMTMANLYLQKLDDNLKPIGKAQSLIPPPFTRYNPNFMAYVWSPDSKKIVFTTSKLLWKSPGYMALHILDLEKKSIKTISEGSHSFDDLSFSPNGQQLAFIKYPSMGEQGKKVRPFRDMSPSVIQIIDLNTKETININATDMWTIAGWTEEGDKLIVLKQEGTKRFLFSVDLKTKILTRLTVPNVSCANAAILSNNQKYIGFLGETLFRPKEAYVSALKHFNPKKISTVNEKINLSEIQAHSLRWKSFDDLEIEGILIYPQGYEKGQKVPLIVSIHGGPQGVNSEFFIGRTWFGCYSPAVFASLGYATLVVNYRGSMGYGMQFQKLDYQDIGGGDFKDIMAGIDYLISKEIVDPEKLFIDGHSYGGFMSAWAVGHTNRFKAASVGAGIVDWISYIATTDYSTTLESIFGEHYWDNYELWRKSSPLNYVTNVKTPTLFLQGEADKRVPKTQAQQFYQALRDREIPTRLVTYVGEEHTFEDPNAIMDVMNETIKWFKLHGK